MTFSHRMEKALRLASVWHQGQERRSSGVPYVEHVMAVAWILDRLGFDEDVTIAGLLHDAVEDTEATLEDLRGEFGERVAEIVGHCSEVKIDAHGRKRPWIDRKRDHLAALASAPLESKAVALADKLHNLLSIEVDLTEGRSVWSSFNADREQVLWYYRSVVDALREPDPRMETLAEQCQALLAKLEAFAASTSRKSDV